MLSKIPVQMSQHEVVRILLLPSEQTPEYYNGYPKIHN